MSPFLQEGGGRSLGSAETPKDDLGPGPANFLTDAGLLGSRTADGARCSSPCPPRGPKPTPSVRVRVRASAGGVSVQRSPEESYGPLRQDTPSLSTRVSPSLLEQAQTSSSRPKSVFSLALQPGHSSSWQPQNRGCPSTEPVATRAGRVLGGPVRKRGGAVWRTGVRVRRQPGRDSPGRPGGLSGTPPSVCPCPDCPWSPEVGQHAVRAWGPEDHDPFQSEVPTRDTLLQRRGSARDTSSASAALAWSQRGRQGGWQPRPARTAEGLTREAGGGGRGRKGHSPQAALVEMF